MHIEGKRIYLRRFKEEDTQATYDYLSDKEVVKYEPYEAMTLDEVKEVVKSRVNDSAFYAVCLKETDELIGNLYFDPFDDESYILGYVFNRKYQKKGYASESVKVLMKEAFFHMNIDRIEAKCNPLNENSWLLLERVGFKRYAHIIKNISFKNDASGNPIWQDTYEYSLSKATYFKDFEENLDLEVLEACAKSCIDQGKLAYYQKVYDDVQGDYQKFMESLEGCHVALGETYDELVFPNCTCDMVKNKWIQSPKFCECSKQSILYVLSTLFKEMTFVVDKKGSILNGDENCCFHIYKRKG